MECASLRDAGIGMATVMITTGGTGGHIFPGLAVASELKSRGASVFWLGTNDGMESRLVPKHEVDFEGIGFSSVRGKGWKRLLFGPYAIANACWQASKIIARKQPGLVVGFGGFASFPGALMGVARNLPLVIHNLDARAGLANRVLKHGADRVLTGFPGVLGEGRNRARRMGRQSVARRYRGRRAARAAVQPAAAGRCVCSCSAEASARSPSTTSFLARSP